MRFSSFLYIQKEKLKTCANGKNSDTYTFELFWDYLKLLFALDHFHLQLMKNVLNLLGQLLRLPLAQVLIRVLVVPHNHGLLLIDERAIGLL